MKTAALRNLGQIERNELIFVLRKQNNLKMQG